MVLTVNLFLLSVGCRHKQLNMDSDYANEGMIPVQGTQLHYLQWGTNGEPLVMLHGLGDSPYIFSRLALGLSDHFKVIAYARRGHGQSGSPEQGYDNQTLTVDLKSLVDSLHLDRVYLLGWSMGGNEITEFAIRFPERTAGLIYLEAGYDYSEPAFASILKHIPVNFLPDSSDLASINTYRQWYHRFWFPDIEWNEALESNLKASTRILDQGRVEVIPSDTITKLLLRSLTLYPRQYSKIAVPVLALFTSEFFKHAATDRLTQNAYEDLEKNIISPWRKHSKERIKNELRHVRIHDLSQGGHASVLFASQDSLIELVTDFISSH